MQIRLLKSVVKNYGIFHGFSLFFSVQQLWPWNDLLDERPIRVVRMALISKSLSQHLPRSRLTKARSYEGVTGPQISPLINGIFWCSPNNQCQPQREPCWPLSNLPQSIFTISLIGSFEPLWSIVCECLWYFNSESANRTVGQIPSFKMKPYLSYEILVKYRKG